MYKVVRCPNCTNMQITSSKTLKCSKCGKTKVMNYLKVYFKSDSAKECQLYMSDYKEKIAKEKGNYSLDFK